MGQLTVEELMTPNPITVGVSEDLGLVFDLMRVYRMRHMPIVSDQGRLAGLISHRDIMKLMGRHHRCSYKTQMEQLKSVSASEAMVREVKTVSSKSPIWVAGQLLYDQKLGCLPVVDGMHLEGILTEADFIKFVLKKESSRTKSEGWNNVWPGFDQAFRYWVAC